MPSTQAAVSIQAVHLPLDKIDPSPWQHRIRPYSEKYAAYVDEEKADELFNIIGEKGYDESDPVLVRPKAEGRYEFVKGHTRHASVARLEHKTILAIVREMTDAEAAITLVTGQGKGLDGWAHARHAYTVCKAHGGQGLMSVGEYATAIGKDIATISHWIAAAELQESLHPDESFPVGKLSSDFSVTTAREIASLPKADWQWFTQITLERQWNGDQRTAAIAAIKAIRDVKVPEAFAEWLNVPKWKREAAIEATEAPQPQTVNNLKRLVRAATSTLENLPEERPVWRFNESGQPYREVMRLQDLFLAGLLQKANPPSEAKIKALCQELLEQVTKLDQKYKKWQTEQHSVEEAQKAAEDVALARLALEQEYRPTGYASRLEALNLELDFYDAITTQYQSEDFTPHWLPIVAETLKPGGVLICTCLNDDLFDLHEEGQRSDLLYLDLLTWLRPDASPSERFTSGFEFIYVAVKPGLVPYFDAERVQTQFPPCKLTNVIDFIQADPSERLEWDANQPPVELAEFLLTAYVPPKGTILNPFARSASFTRAAKRLGCKATWIESNPYLFAKAEALIEQAPFTWEL